MQSQRSYLLNNLAGVHKIEHDYAPRSEACNTLQHRLQHFLVVLVAVHH